MRRCSLDLRILACLAIFLAILGLSCKKTDADKSSMTSADSGADNIAGADNVTGADVVSWSSVLGLVVAIVFLPFSSPVAYCQVVL